ncbi:MAG: sigma-70 family RNA polymerase sigma factor [Planctomycetes bacterium]|nr:sigma-70 family RNA polymerase sigma factor [Planctomycetota bacterium]
MSETSASLLEDLRERSDPRSWRRLMDVYWPLVYGWLRQRGLQHDDAEDLGQDVLHVLMRELPRFRYDRNRGTFRGWLRTITANRLRNFRRKHRARPVSLAETDWTRIASDLEDPASQLSQQWDQEHDRFVARRLLAAIEGEFEPTTWQAFRRVAYDGDKPAAVAGDLGISVNAVFIAKSRVMRRLRDKMRELFEQLS